MDKHVYIIGAAGYIGSNLVRRMYDSGYLVTAVGRDLERLNNIAPCTDRQLLADFLSESAWEKILVSGAQAVIYAAGKAHVTDGKSAKSKSEYYAANCEAPLIAARVAKAKMIKRFVYISSLSVFDGRDNRVYRECDPVNPMGDYARSKYVAEQRLSELLHNSGTELVIVRPPMVYGAGAPGNFSTLAAWLRRGVPLPFALLRNRRSFISIDRLSAFIQLCVEHPHAGGELFLIADHKPLSTPDFIRSVGDIIGVQPLLFPVPVFILSAVLGLLLGKEQSSKLLGSFEITADRARSLLGWDTDEEYK